MMHPRRWPWIFLVLLAAGIALSLAVVQTLIAVALVPSPEMSDHHDVGRIHCNCQHQQQQRSEQAVLPLEQQVGSVDSNCDQSAQQKQSPQQQQQQQRHNNNNDGHSSQSLIGARIQALAGKVNLPPPPSLENNIEHQQQQQQQPQAAPNNDNEQPEFPFPLSCPTPSSLFNNKNNNYQIVLAYHVGMMRNWRNVVRDQLQTLTQCGLAKAAQRIFISYSYTEFERHRIVEGEQRRKRQQKGGGEQKSRKKKHQDNAVDDAKQQQQQQDDEEADTGAVAQVQNVWNQFAPQNEKDPSRRRRRRLQQKNIEDNKHKKNQQNQNQQNNQPQDVMLRALQSIWEEYATHFRVHEPTWIFSHGVPWEGTILNHVRQHCIQQETNNNNDNNNNTTAAANAVDDYQPTIVFYFHTKGTSRYKATWRQQLQQPYTYSRVLYWRKYMEYFLLERPTLCIDKIVHQGALTCGVDHRTTGVYAGNFWAASCEYVAALPELSIHESHNNNNSNSNGGGKKKDKEHYFDMEHTFGRAQRQWKAPERFVSLHQPNASLKGFYYRLMEPAEYSLEDHGG